MHTGTSYKLSEFLKWTRRDIYVLMVLGVVPVVAYQIGSMKWLGIPWTVVALLGTATAFIVGFKNLQTYNRTWEARQIWGDSSSSRAWGTMSRDFCDHAEQSTALVYHHLAWLTALRYQLREHRVWETTSQAHHAEYLQYYAIPERHTALATELAKYLPDAERKQILATGSKATQIMSLQSQTITGLLASQAIVVVQFLDMHRALKGFLWHQGRCERLKDFPYPRHYATINALFIKWFCLLLPCGLLRAFDKCNDSVEGVIKGHMV
jgi:putative membrane protein